MKHPTRLRPLGLGSLTLPNRIVMAPLTRARANLPGDVPTALMAQYYAQRTSAGLIVSEAIQIGPQGKGYRFTPGMYSADQVAGRRLVTQVVHAASGRMYLQLWHVERMLDCPTPRVLTEPNIAGILNDFRQAARSGSACTWPPTLRRATWPAPTSSQPFSMRPAHCSSVASVTCICTGPTGTTHPRGPHRHRGIPGTFR